MLIAQDERDKKQKTKQLLEMLLRINEKKKSALDALRKHNADEKQAQLNQMEFINNMFTKQIMKRNKVMTKLANNCLEMKSAEQIKNLQNANDEIH